MMCSKSKNLHTKPIYIYIESHYIQEATTYRKLDWVTLIGAALTEYFFSVQINNPKFPFLTN